VLNGLGSQAKIAPSIDAIAAELDELTVRAER
jgi:hypothetical protein